MRNFLDDKPNRIRDYLFRKLNDVRVLYESVIKVEGREPYSGPLLTWVINGNNIAQLINYFEGMVKDYIKEGGLELGVAALSTSIARKESFSPEDVVNLFSSIYYLSDKEDDVPLPFLPENINKHIKFAYKNSDHLNGVSNFLQNISNLISGFYYSFAYSFKNPATVTDEGAEYLALQYNLSFPDEASLEDLTLEDKRRTLQLDRAYQMWGGDIYSYNSALRLILKGAGTGILRVDNTSKTLVLTLKTQRRINKYALDLWGRMGLLPPQKLGFKTKLVLLDDLPIGFNAYYTNFLKGSGVFSLDKNADVSPVKNGFVHLSYAFADQGDKRDILDIQGSEVSSLSMEKGFTSDYEHSIEEGGFVLERKKINWLLNKLYQDYTFFQRNSMLEWNSEGDYSDPNGRKGLRVKYEGKVYVRNGKEDDGEVPSNSEAWDLLDYGSCLTIKEFYLLLDELFPVGLTWDGLVGTIANLPKDSAYTSQVFPWLDNKSEDAFFSRVRKPSLSSSDVQAGTIKEHFHPVTIKESEWVHNHTFANEARGYFQPKVEQTVDLWSSRGDRPLFYGASKEMTGRSGNHSHYIQLDPISKNDVYPRFIDMEKIVKETSFESLNYINSDRGKTTVKISKKMDYFIFASHPDALTRKIPNSGVDSVNWQGGFGKAYEEGGVEPWEEMKEGRFYPLDVSSFNEIIKRHTTFVRQAYSRGWVPYKSFEAYDYGCRVRLTPTRYVFISLKDNNKAPLTDKKSWLEESDIITENQAIDVINKIINEILPTLSISLNAPPKDSDSVMLSNPWTSGVPRVNNPDLYKIIGNYYGDSSESSVCLPILHDTFIRTNNKKVGLKFAKTIQPYSIGDHSHYGNTEMGGGHRHETIAANSRFVAGVYCPASGDCPNRFSGAFNSKHIWIEPGSGIFHNHEIIVQTTGEGAELKPKSITVYYQWRSKK